MKSGKIIETTKSNLSNPGYYGVELKGAELQAFIDWVTKNKPGSGKVRSVKK